MGMTCGQARPADLELDLRTGPWVGRRRVTVLAELAFHNVTTVLTFVIVSMESLITVASHADGNGTCRDLCGPRIKCTSAPGK